MPPRPHFTQDDAYRVWDTIVVTMAGVSPVLARKAWKAMLKERQCLALRYELEQVLQRGAPGSAARYEAVWRLLTGPAGPQPIIDTLECLVATKAISRSEATLMEERLLALVNRQGQWKALAKH